MSNNSNTVTSAIIDTKKQYATLKDISSHYPKMFGVITLKLDCISDTLVKEAGSWILEVFEMYIC